VQGALLWATAILASLSLECLWSPKNIYVRCLVVLEMVEDGERTEEVTCSLGWGDMISVISCG